MDFNSIIGQEEVVTNLKNLIADERVGHAYIFAGPKGIGKRSIARIFASMLLCSAPKNNGCCGTCMQCTMLKEGSNPDYTELDTEGKSIGVGEIRRIQADVIVRPMYSKRKVYLIADSERMTVQAQNSLLKTLEEPPEYTVIILTTSNYDALLETIRSRAIRYNLKNNTPEEVRTFLASIHGAGIKAIDFITAYSGGIIGTALKLAGSDDFVETREKTLEIVLKLARGQLGDIFEIYSFFEKNKDEINTILDIMILFYRDLLIMQKTSAENMLINSDKKDIILSSLSRFPAGKLLQNIETVEVARKNLKQNANYQLLVEVMLMKLQEELY
jgi:DNA polymerase-3 subunit delta'